MLDYSVAIRTLGKAGEKYQRTLDSLSCQTIKPKKIVIYIAEGYPIPQETIGIEKYVYVKKGMLAQRALPYDEITSEYILFLDDDVYLPPNGVEELHNELLAFGADVISPDVFKHSSAGVHSRILMMLSGRMKPRKNDLTWGYKIMRNGGFSYNLYPKQGAMLSQSNAGPCFLCKKSAFLSIRLSDELWLDHMKYALGDDQVMFYKMFKSGLKVLTSFDSGIVHLDAGSSTANTEKEKLLAFSDAYFKTIFWHRFIALSEKSLLNRTLDVIAFVSTVFSNLGISLIKCQFPILGSKARGYRDGINFVRSSNYRSLPRI